MRQKQKDDGSMLLLLYKPTDGVESVICMKIIQSVVADIAVFKCPDRRS